MAEFAATLAEFAATLAELAAALAGYAAVYAGFTVFKTVCAATAAVWVVAACFKQSY